MATVEFARGVLRKAGEQERNRTTVVIRKEARPREGSQVPVGETLRVGAVTLPDWRYTGASNRMNEDDPHEAAYAVLMVAGLLKDHPEWAEVFDRWYVQDRYHGVTRREEFAMATELAERLGVVENEETIVADILREHRMNRMRRRREKQADYVRAHRERAAEAV